ncbi:MAG: hypothetical protein IJ300_14320 [Clostridia bacterium]|nr:hypothetical protein [Clostridia bacterium]
MKRILSITLTVMMICSLFAVNASAAVAHGTIPQVVASQDFSDVENNTFMTSKNQGSADINLADGVATLTYKSEDASYVVLSEPNSNLDYTTLPDKFYFDFDVEVVNASLPFQVNFPLPTKDAEGNAVDGRIGVRIFPATFNSAITKDSAYTTDSTLFDINKTYSFRIMVDQGKYYSDRANLISNGYEGNTLYDNSVLQVYIRKENGFYTTLNKYTGGCKFTYSRGYRTFSKGNCSATQYATDAITLVLFQGAHDSTFAANAKYSFDNMKLSWEEDIPSKGVISYQDYEGTSTLATTTTYGALTPAVDANGNHFLKMTNKNASYNVLVIPADNGDFTKEDVTVTFDICAQKPGAFGAEIYGKTDDTALNDQESMLFFRTDEGMEIGKWYRYKLSAGGKDVSTKVARKNLTDNGEWEILAYSDNTGSKNSEVYEYGVGACGSSGNGRIRLVSVYEAKRQPEGADPTNVEWWIDNIIVTNTEAISFPDVEVTDETISVTVNYEDGYDYFVEAMKPVLAVYDKDGRLVDVAMDTKATAAGEIAATLTVDAASYTEDGEIKLLVWDGGETAAPILSEAYDISTLLN